MKRSSIKQWTGACVALAAIWLMASPVGAATNLTQGLVSLWRFDEGTGVSTDDSADGNDGTLNGGAGWTSDTPFAYPGNTALALTGSPQYAGFGDPANLFFPSAFSVSAWVNMSTTSAANSFVVSDYSIGANRSSFSLYITQTEQASFAWENPNGTFYPASSTTILNTGVWYHLVGTYDGTTRRLYVNGVLEASNSNGQPRFDGGGITAVGRAGSSSQANLHLIGLVDDVGFWNRAIEQDEVNWLSSNNTLSIPEPSAALLAAGALLALLRKRTA